jgi:xanthine phosphoribosyltransferase
MTYYPYEKFVTDVKALVKLTSEYQPDALIAIARGGLTLGHAYAMVTNNRQLKRCYCLMTLSTAGRPSKRF